MSSEASAALDSLNALIAAHEEATRWTVALRFGRQRAQRAVRGALQLVTDFDPELAGTDELAELRAALSSLLGLWEVAPTKARDDRRAAPDAGEYARQIAPELAAIARTLVGLLGSPELVAREAGKTPGEVVGVLDGTWTPTIAECEAWRAIAARYAELALHVASLEGWVAAWRESYARSGRDRGA